MEIMAIEGRPPAGLAFVASLRPVLDGGCPK
jgi:hypothetical protein